MARVIWLSAFIIIILISDAIGSEVAYSFGDLGGHPLPMGNVTEYNGSDIVTSAINSASIGADSAPTEGKSVDGIKKEINLKLNVGNQAVRDKGHSLTVDYSGDRTIRQICSLYDVMVGNWSYLPDTRGIEEFQYSNKTLEYGMGKKVIGQGDCDDFSILLASLIESIGGTSRIMLAYGPMGGHAYTEVYLGKAEGIDSDVDRMIKWLMARYNAHEINVHTDLDTGDVWLNLDWWRDTDTGIELTKHPGGPFFRATSQTPIPIREDIAKLPLEPLNNPPLATFTVSSTVPNAEEIVTFDASSSRDIGDGGRIEYYGWDFGDGNKLNGKIVQHAYSGSGKFAVNLTVRDLMGAEGFDSKIIRVKGSPRIANLGTSEFTWTTSNFDGFYYDIDNNLGLEKLIFKLSDINPERAVLSDQTDSNGTRGIIYSTQVQQKNFDFGPWGQYNVIGFLGEMYFAGYDDHATKKMVDAGEYISYLYYTSNNKSLLVNKQICRVLIDSGTEQTITQDKSLELKEDYRLEINSIDRDSNEVDLTLTKDGDIVDRKIIQPSIDNAKISDGTYLYKSDLGDTTGIVQIAIHFKNIYQELDTDKATIDGVFQISESPISIKPGTEYDKMSIRNVNLASMSITMDNEYEKITLSKNKDIVLMGNIHIKTSDSNAIEINSPLKYYLYKIHEEPGIYELRGAVTDLSSNDFSWTTDNFAGFHYDIDNNIGSEQLIVRLSSAGPDSANLIDFPDSNGTRGIVYTTQAQRKNFKFEPWGMYWVIGFLGDEYFVAYDGNTTLKMDVSNVNIPCLDSQYWLRNIMAYQQISKVIIDSDDEITFSTDEPLELEDGYQIRIKSVDQDVNKAYVVLEKDGEEVDSKVVVVYSSDPDDSDYEKTYYYKDNLGDAKRTILLAVHFKNLFRGSNKYLATVDGIFQISKKIVDISQGTLFDAMAIRSIDACAMKIIMDNEDNPITLVNNMNEILMNNIYIKTANQDIIDSNNPLRLCIYKLLEKNNDDLN